ncbi:MAG: hypothetical protein A2V78_07405 [Betaproteobacteria bacterium RBG_16_64_18]|nr:MAG: hypothetical protein A2V78_07405 [Betaproteobacteria bacterium RBG_16_64_18]
MLEDNAGDARLVQTALAEHAPGEFAVTRVERLADALVRIASEHFDAVLCDLGLPDSTGLATAQAIAARAAALPLVVLTGSHNEDLGREAIHHGAQDYVIKGEASGPIVARTLRYAIERKRLEIGIRVANESLAHRVAERTAELEAAMKQLGASEARFRELTELTSDWYWEQDEQFRFKWFSEGAMKHIGIDIAEYVGCTRRELPIDQVTEEQWAEHRRQTEAHLPFRDFEYRWTNRSGGQFYLSISGRPVFDEQGRFNGYHGVGSDITKRKRAELALARQKDLYETLSQTNQVIVRGTSREELFQAACRIAVVHGRFRFAWIGLIDKADQQVKLVAKYGEDAGYLGQLRMSMDESTIPGRSVTGAALRAGRRGVSNDFLNDPLTAPWHEAAQRAGVRAFAAFPVRQGGAVVGAISFYAGEPGFFTDDLLATLDEMALDVSFALDNFERETERARAVDALRESEARYRSLFENMLNGFAYCRMLYDDHDRPVDFVYLDVNNAFERLTGLKNVVGKQVTEVIPGVRESTPELFEIYGRVATTGVPEAFEIYVEPLRHWFSISVYGPEKGHFVAVFDVITERKRAEALLRESEERLRTIFEGALDGILIADAQTGEFLNANPEICRMLGYSPEEIVGLGIADIHREQDLPHAMEQFERLRRGEIQTASDVPMLRKDGSVFYAEIKAAPIRLGGMDRMLGIFRDITERKRTQRELADSEERFRGLVEQSIAGIYIIQDGKFAYVNPRYTEIFGYGSAEELIGLDPLAIVAEKDRAAAAENIRRRLEGDAPNLSYEFAAQRKDGSTIEVGVHGSRATFRGRPAVIGLIQDISEKKRAEEEIRRYVAQLETAFMSTVQVATTLSEMRDPYTTGHERRVAEVSVAIGAELGFDERRLEGLRVAGYLHDIGKITIPSEILSKPGKLSTVEFELIKGHAQASYDVLKDVEFPWPVAQVALQHHERLDGSGYPHGLKGEAILLEARIMAVADVVEAMSSHRPYRPGLGIDKALAEIERGRGSAYDPAVVDACLRLFRDRGYAIPA